LNFESHHLWVSILQHALEQAKATSL